MWNRKRNDTDELTKETDLENKLIVVRGKGSQGLWEGHATLLYLKLIINKDLLYSAWNSAQWYVPAWMGGGFGRRRETCICVTESLHHSSETATTLLINYTLIQNKKFKVKGKTCLFSFIYVNKLKREDMNYTV